MPDGKPTTLASRPSLRIGTFHVFVCDRLFEWFAAIVMVGMAICLSVEGAVLTGAMADLGQHREALALFMGTFGVVRIAALAANGNVPVYGPRARSICALCAGPVWSILGFALLIDAINGKVSLGLPVYLGLILAEIYSAHRATCDVGRP